jgi:5-methyltetrahydrofolate--homocysteine methyltransferase
MQDLLLRLKDAIMAGEEEDTARLVAESLEAGVSAEEMLKTAMAPAMQEIGERFSRNEAFIPELIVAAAAMEKGLALLKPLLGGREKAEGCIVLGTVQGDIHHIGKNLVRMCLEGAGFEVIDIGEDLKAEKFAEAYRQYQPDILGLSALLSSTMQHLPEVIRAVRAIDGDALVMVGGAPVTQEYADQVGANGYAPDAFLAVRKARELIAARTA